MSGASYKVKISMDEGTVTSLLDSGFTLYGFKAVQDTDKGGRPLVWFQTSKFSTSISVEWTAQYQGYTSTSEIIPNGQISASFSVDMELGQILKVGVGGIGDVVDGGRAGTISLQNTTSTPYTCGISQVQNGSPKPLCAFPLHGLNLAVITPVEKVLLLFSTSSVSLGTVIDHIGSTKLLNTATPGIFINMNNQSLREVTYNIDAGWSWGNFSWAQEIPVNTDLVPILIDPISGSKWMRR